MVHPRQTMDDFSQLKWLDMKQASKYFGIDQIRLRTWMIARHENGLIDHLLIPPTPRGNALINKETFMSWFRSKDEDKKIHGNAELPEQLKESVEERRKNKKN